MAETRKEEFQKYLEKSGVIDTLTKVLVNLYEAPEKPQNAINFIKESMGPPAPGGDVEKLQAQVKEQAVLLEQKDKEIEELKQKLAALTEEQKKAE
mmetsp:Transcript_24778/g.44082  ORF Transcript_24778/g.44082 Transcript_24778/m.44082 type:complete len:96 (-) Transcript_24778:291-578(-)|eukprot:CAMPEP_0197514754 /NCGR_PEP_ID=MMETSP1318-20131121/104_1 /TAXON_ID=552666 /ORGANISM="Partenskyella glossopodia, Strain RCC365" /LENGTH=95 /DNA_ID=CAMNT_0043062939 /DNA_START=46 /DNA_END=333 /DNA_ORIENTATION=-